MIALNAYLVEVSVLLIIDGTEPDGDVIELGVVRCWLVISLTIAEIAAVQLSA